MQTSGHLATNGGIRGHSAGDIFPYIIMLKGTEIGTLRYHLIGNGIPEGTFTRRFESAGYDELHHFAISLKES